MSLPGYSLIVNPLSMSSTANDTASALQTFGDNIVQSGVALICETLLYGACSTLQALNILTREPMTAYRDVPHPHILLHLHPLVYPSARSSRIHLVEALTIGYALVAVRASGPLRMSRCSW